MKCYSMKHDLKYDYSLIESVEELNKYGPTDDVVLIEGTVVE